MALVHLKNAAIVDPTQTDPSHTKAVLLASERKGKDLFRQVYDITFQTRSGKAVEVIARSDASREECSMSGVDVYIVSRKLAGLRGATGSVRRCSRDAPGGGGFRRPQPPCRAPGSR